MQLVDPGIVAAQAEVARLQAQRLAHGEKGVAGKLLRHHAQQAAGLQRLALHIHAQHARAAGAGARQSGQDAEAASSG